MPTTNTVTTTVTHAEYLSSKIAADLKQMQSFYGDPSDVWIDKYVQELIILFKGGYLSSVDYGYKKDDKYILAVSYSVNETTGTLIDNNPGRIPAGVDVSGTEQGSFMRYTSKFKNLSTEERQALDNRLPFKRTYAVDPLTGIYGTQDKTYSAGNLEVKRQIIK